MSPIQIFWIFLKLGLTSFGGPVAHLAYFREAFVKQRNWFTEQQYAHLVVICQTIPGPASSQVGFAIGLLKGGWLGGLLASVAFTLPSVALLIIFANSLALFDSSISQTALHGLAILALIVVLQAVMGMSKQLLKSRLSWIFATVMFVLVLLTNNFVFGFLGIVACAVLNCFVALGNENDDIEFAETDLCAGHRKYSLTTTWIAGTAFVCLVIVFVGNPFNVSQYFYEHAPAYFTSGAMVFGGGHVVLPFLEQTTVAQGLVSEDVFLAGYGATQALPGPMFSFAAYLGYMTELQQQTNTLTSASIFTALVSGLLATVFVFLPGFLLITAILPISQKLSAYPKVKAAFTGANAAVVGLLTATLYDPVFTHSINTNQDLVVFGIGFMALTRFKFPVIVVVCLCVLLKVMFHQVG